MDIEILRKKLRREGRSDSFLAQCRGMLFQIFNKAEANDLVKKNPVRFAEKMRKHYLHVQDPIKMAAISKFDKEFFEQPETRPNIIDFVRSS